MSQTSRRSFLQGAAVAAAGVAVPSAAEAYSGGGRPDPDHPRFTLAVIPDTQYLFDQDRGDPAPLAATLRYIADHRASENVVFTAHLGDIVENADPAGLATAGRVFGYFDRRRDQPAHASLFFDGGKRPARGAYLRTADGAPLNAATFDRGYTIEAFVMLPSDVRSTDHAWMSIVSRMGAGYDAGKTGGDPAEPLATLSMSDGMALQWAVFPRNQDGISTNWGHEMRAGEWFHVAVVNDGRTTTLYVDGAELLRNPSTPAVGLASSNEPWYVGAYHYDRIVEQGFYGWLGDVRIVDRALPVSGFMRA